MSFTNFDEVRDAMDFYHADLDAVSKAVLIYIAKFKNPNNGACYPSVRALSENCLYGTATINRAIKRLKTIGVLKVENRTTRGLRGAVKTSNSYKLDFKLSSKKEVKPVKEKKQVPQEMLDLYRDTAIAIERDVLKDKIGSKNKQIIETVLAKSKAGSADIDLLVKKMVEDVGVGAFSSDTAMDVYVKEFFK